MDAKDFLELGRSTTMTIKAKRAIIETLQDEISHMERFAGSVPKHSTKDRPIYEALQLAYQMQNEVKEEIEDLRLQQTDMIKSIEAVPDPLCRELLARRFIQDEDWPQIADELFYTVRYMLRLQKKALDLIEVPEKYRNM